MSLNVLIAPDKFKGSLSARAVCEAIGKGLQAIWPDANLTHHPMADGGDGSVEILTDHFLFEKRTVSTVDPLGRPLTGHYFAKASTAFIELAAASGLVLLTPEDRNPYLTSTLGTGIMIKDALENGYSTIYLFLGGSATNDAGTGIAAALGYSFYDEENQRLHPAGANLQKIHSIQSPDTEYATSPEFTLLCDVNNPLHGPNGAAFVYAEQKGANAWMIEQLDKGLQHYGDVLFRYSGMNISKLPGSGAAGGIAASMVALFDAQLKAGFPTIAQLTGLEAKIQQADLVITGEGKLDSQSLQGKVVDGIASLCAKYDKPVAYFVGGNALDDSAIKKLGGLGIHAIMNIALDRSDAMSHTENYLQKLANDFAKAYQPNH